MLKFVDFYFFKVLPNVWRYGQ